MNQQQTVRPESRAQRIQAKYHSLLPLMDERMRRQWAAAEARALGWGGLRIVSQALGMSPNTIRKGLAELEARENDPQAPVSRDVRRKGGGRKRRSGTDSGLIQALEAMVEPVNNGDVNSPLRWTCKSTSRLAEELNRIGHAASPRTVGRLLNENGYNLETNAKARNDRSYIERNTQFEFICTAVQQAQEQGQPVIFVSAWRREFAALAMNDGREWQMARPMRIRMHEFVEMGPDKVCSELSSLSDDQGWISKGGNEDTVQFAAQAIIRWWRKTGIRCFGDARTFLLITDGCANDAARCRLWKANLQDVARELKIPLRVCHFPRGTRKWNTISHRVIFRITEHGRERPWAIHEIMIQVIAPADRPALNSCSGTKLACLSLKYPHVHQNWSYMLLPNQGGAA